jgi:hypothetical protein
LFEQNRLVRFALEDLLATGLRHVGGRRGSAVMGISRPLMGLEVGVGSHVTPHRNFPGFAAVHWCVGQQSTGGMTDREDHRWRLP